MLGHTLAEDFEDYTKQLKRSTNEVFYKLLFVFHQILQVKFYPLLKIELTNGIDFKFATYYKI